MATYKTAGGQILTDLTYFYTCPVGKTAIVRFCQVCNKTSQSTALSGEFYDKSADNSWTLIGSLVVPANSTLKVIDSNLVLEAGDKIGFSASQSYAMDVVLSMVEI